MKTIISSSKEEIDKQFHDDLRPCPFCGGEADVHVKTSYERIAKISTNSDMYSIQCSYCKSRTRWHGTLEYVVWIWNREDTKWGEKK